MNARLDRDPLTMRYARTLKDTVRDPSDWWTTAEAAIAEEAHIRAMFAEQDKQVQSLTDKWATRCIYLIGAGVLIAYFMGAFK